MTVMEKITKKILSNKMVRKIYFWVMPFIVGLLHTRHIHGPRKILGSENDVLLFFHVKNGELFIKAFLDYHFSLGVRHAIMLDNQSTDKTVEIAKGYTNVTIFSNNIDKMGYREVHFENFLINKMCKKRWCLNVDIDELFDYPGSDKIPLNEFIRYLNKYRYTTVVGYMLDLFPEYDLNSSQIKSIDIKSDFCFYDISLVNKLGYQNSEPLNNRVENIISNPRIYHYTGGIRKKVFDVNPGLTKHPLTFQDGSVRRINCHYVTNAKCADVSTVLYHYKFAEIYEKSKLYIQTSFGSISEYKKYCKTFEQTHKLVIKTENTKKLESVNDLIQERFLEISANYLGWINKPV